jgi:hypothetical protein
MIPQRRTVGFHAATPTADKITHLIAKCLHTKPKVVYTTLARG